MEKESFSINDRKTQELLQDLRSDGNESVDVEDLAKYLKDQGLIVKVHVGRIHGNFNVTPELFGVNVSEKGTDVNDFFNKYLKLGNVSFIPEAQEKALSKIEQRLRSRVRAYAVGLDDTFMPLSYYSRFMNDFKEAKAEYLALRDSISEQWDFLIEDFKRIFWNSLGELNSIDKEKIFSSVLRHIPSLETYRSSFYMQTRIRALPTIESATFKQNPELEQQLVQDFGTDTVQLTYEIVKNLLSEAFGYTSKVLVGIARDNGIQSRTVQALAEAAARIRRKNVLGNAKVEEYCSKMQKIVETIDNDIDLAAETAETLTKEIYQYGKSLGLTLDLSKCPLMESELVA